MSASNCGKKSSPDDCQYRSGDRVSSLLRSFSPSLLLSLPPCLSPYLTCHVFTCLFNITLIPSLGVSHSSQTHSRSLSFSPPPSMFRRLYLCHIPVLWPWERVTAISLQVFLPQAGRGVRGQGGGWDQGDTQGVSQEWHDTWCMRERYRLQITVFMHFMYSHIRMSNRTSFWCGFRGSLCLLNALLTLDGYAWLWNSGMALPSLSFTFSEN